MKVHRIIFLTVLTFFLTACDVDLYRSLPEDEANQMLALLMQHHIDAEKTGRGRCYLTCRAVAVY